MSQIEFLAVSQALESADPLLSVALVLVLLVSWLARPARVAPSTSARLARLPRQLAAPLDERALSRPAALDALAETASAPAVSALKSSGL